MDVGQGFNKGGGSTPSPSTLASVGLGLRLQVSDRLMARFDWGIPLTDIAGEKRTLVSSELGFYFSLIYNQPF